MKLGELDLNLLPNNISKNMVDDFEKSIVWLAILKLVNDHIDDIHELMYECPNKTIYLPQQDGSVKRVTGIEFYQGAIDELREVVNYPSRLIKETKLEV